MATKRGRGLDCEAAKRLTYGNYGSPEGGEPTFCPNGTNFRVLFPGIVASSLVCLIAFLIMDLFFHNSDYIQLKRARLILLELYGL